MNSYLLKDVLIETIATFSNVENSTHSVINSQIQRLVPEWNNDFQKKSAKLLKLGKLERLDIKNKEIIIAVQSSPVGICCDGASYNNEAAKLLSELYGFQCPSYRCSAHICDGTAYSPQILELFENLEKVDSGFLNLNIKDKISFYYMVPNQQLPKAPITKFLNL